MAEKSVIEAIKVLRDRTGAGMMDCKKALEENNYDIELAVDWLRKKGIAKAGSRSERIAAEGLAAVKVCEKGHCAVIVEVNSETDFVSRSENFAALVEATAETILKEKPENVEAAIELTKPLFTDATVKLGEKLDLRRFQVIKRKEDEEFGIYIHMGGKIAVLVVTNSKDNEINKGIAMHIAAEAPVYIQSSDIPAAVRTHEESVQKELALQDEKIQSKPVEMQKKILENKINSVLNEGVLYEQGYLLLDGKEKVGQFLKQKGVEVHAFVRYKVGEGIEKREDNFAEEVLKQSN